MSFGFTVKHTVGEDVTVDVEKAVEAEITKADAGNYEANVKKAIDLDWFFAVENYLINIVERVGREGDVLNISISGHANPEKGKNPGWGSNMLTIGISQIYKEDI